jgi:DNA-binding NarL/FixJ family response regulator
LDGGRWISDPLVDQLVDPNATSKTSSPQISLTRRQRELLYFLTLGYNNQKIARVLNLSIKTVENHLTSLYRSIDAEGRLEASNFGNNHPDLLYTPDQMENHTNPELNRVEELSVLLVDDNAHYRTQLGKLVRRACPTCSLFEAEDPTEAERIARQVKPDLAFIDVVLKDEDGIRCVKGIKTVSSDTRMILISAYPDWGFRQAGLRAGAVAFLDKKDIDASTVQEVVADILEG